MCTVSMIGDHYHDKWRDYDWFTPNFPNPEAPVIPPPLEVTREEFDELRRDVLEMKELLKRAKKYDEENGEPDCEIEEKMELLRRVAKLVGVDLNDVIGANQ